MSPDVDIRQLAIVREDAATPQIQRRRHVLSRYVVPGLLVSGFAAVVAWAAWDNVFPPQPVWVVPVMASQSATQQEGTPLFQAAGWVEPRPTPIRVAALAPGVVEKLLVVQDQRVKGGEPVATLVNQDAKFLRDHAVADLRIGEASVSVAQAEVRAARTKFEKPVHLQAALGEAEASLAKVTTELTNLPFETRRAEAELKFAEKDYAGKQASEGTVSKRAVNAATSALETARATVEELRARGDSLAGERSALSERRDALKAQLELLADETQAMQQADAKLLEATARLHHATVSLAEAELRLERMTVRAPVDGRVYQLVAFPGTTISGGMSPVANADANTVVTLYQPELLQVRADVRFEDIPKVVLGQQVQIRNPALPAAILGKVLFVSSEANIQKNTLQVKVELTEPSDVLKPEMLVDATFLASKFVGSATTDAEQLRIYVPQQLVARSEAGTFVWVADQSSGRARKTPVTVGSVGVGGIQEITRGLTIGSRIIARGEDGLEDGDRIRVMGEESAAAASAPPARTGEQQLHRFPAGAEANGTH